MNNSSYKRTPREVYSFETGGRHYSFHIDERKFWEDGKSGNRLTKEEENILFNELAEKYFGEESIRHTCGTSLHLVHGCNMGCYYCSVDSGLNFKGTQRILTKDMAKAVIDFIFKEFAHAPSYYLNLAVGGEPLMNYDVLKYVVEYAEAKSREEGKPMTIGLATNGLLLTEEIIRFLNRKNLHKYLSIDGPKPVQDALRVTHAGALTYERVTEKINMIRKIEDEESTPIHQFGGIATLTPLAPDVLGIVDHLLQLGFERIAINPVRSEPDKPFAITAKNISVMKESYTHFANVLLERVLQGDFRYMDAILNHSDFFGRFLIRLMVRGNASYRCTAGKWGFSITADGGIYPCDEFVGMNEYRVGDIFQGIQYDRLNAFHSADVDQLKICSACWAKNICGGLCPKDSIELFGEIGKPNSVECSLIKHVVKLGIHILSTLRSERPDLYYGHLLGKANESLHNRFIYDVYQRILEMCTTRQHKARFAITKRVYGYCISLLLMMFSNQPARRIVKLLYQSPLPVFVMKQFANMMKQFRRKTPQLFEYIFDPGDGMQAIKAIEYDPR